MNIKELIEEVDLDELLTEIYKQKRNTNRRGTGGGSTIITNK